MNKEITKQIIALVPMKGHSERVPRKNMRDFCGLPLMLWILKSLECSKFIRPIFINTDSQEIASEALANFKKVKIIERPENIRGDFVSMNEIIAYDLSQIDGEHFLQTHSTNPLLSTQTIDKAIDFYFDNINQYDSLFSVNRLQKRLYWKDGKPINHNPKELLRTQDLGLIFEENSNIYIFSQTSFFRKVKTSKIGLKPLMFKMDKLEAVDIDEEQDFKMAEALCKLNMMREAFE